MQEHRQQAETAALHEQLALLQTALTDNSPCRQPTCMLRSDCCLINNHITAGMLLHCQAVALLVWSCTTQPCSLASSVSCTLRASIVCTYAERLLHDVCCHQTMSHCLCLILHQRKWLLNTMIQQDLFQLSSSCKQNICWLL